MAGFGLVQTSWLLPIQSIIQHLPQSLFFLQTSVLRYLHPCNSFFLPLIPLGCSLVQLSNFCCQLQPFVWTATPPKCLLYIVLFCIHPAALHLCIGVLLLHPALSSSPSVLSIFLHPVSAPCCSVPFNNSFLPNLSF